MIATFMITMLQQQQRSTIFKLKMSKKNGFQFLLCNCFFFVRVRMENKLWKIKENE